MESESKNLERIKALESELRSLIELSSDFYWELDTGFRLTRLQGPDTENAGFDSRTLIGKCHWEIPTVVAVSDGGSWDRLKTRMDGRQPFSDFVYKHLTLAGKLRYVSISGKPVRDEFEQFIGYRGITREITSRTLIERRIAIEQAVTRILEEAADITVAVNRVMEAVCTNLGWVCAIYWQMDSDTEILHCGHTWAKDESRYTTFLESASELKEIPVGDGGLLSRVCESGKPDSVRNITKDPTFRRCEAAATAKLRNAFAFPVIVNGTVYGVFEFFSPEAGHQADVELLRSATQISSSMGQFISRKLAEAEMRRLTVAIDLSPDLFYLVDPEAMRFLYVNETACRVTGCTREQYSKLSPIDVANVDEAQLKQLYAEVIANGDEGLTSEGVGVAQDGRRGYFETTRRALFINGKPIIASISRDISERKLAEMTAVRQGRMFATLSGTNEAILHSHSPDELYRKVCNAAAEGGQLLGSAILLPDKEGKNSFRFYTKNIQAKSPEQLIRPAPTIKPSSV